MAASRSVRVYGDERRFKANLGQFVSRGESLLDLAQGARKRIAALKQPDFMLEFAIEEEWTREVRKWQRNVYRSIQQHLGDQAEALLPTLMIPLPPDTGKPRHTLTIDNLEPWLRQKVDELAGLREALGVSRNVAAVASPPGRFEELRASGLVDSAVIDGYAREMASPRTTKQLFDAIGAAKEIAEATLRSALDRLGVEWNKGDGIPQLMGKWRQAVRAIAPPDPEGGDTLDKAQGALAGVVNFLAEWRNRSGSGHGPSKYPPGLRRRHARLATDAAETAVRFIAVTLDDFERLPPPPTEGGTS